MEGKRKEKKGFAKRAAMVKSMVSAFKPTVRDSDTHAAPGGKHFGEMDMVPPDDVAETAEVAATFVDPEQTKRLLRGQLTDLTKKLSNALTNIEMYDKDGPDLVANDISRKINQLKSGDMKDQLTSFLVHYNNITEENKENVKEREEIFSTLSDWFTMPNFGSGMKLNFDNYDDTDLKQNYADTLAEFGRLKKLQEEIARLQAQGQNTDMFEEERRRLEKRVIELMKTTQESLPPDKPEKVTEPSVWKKGATEIIDLMKTVRTDHPDVLIGINKRLDSMLDILQQQDDQIHSIFNELQECRMVVSNHIDDNNRLNKELLEAKKKLRKYDKELDLAQTILQQCFATKPDGPSGHPRVTVSSMIDQLGGDPADYDDVEDPSSSSDPFLLRGVIEDQEETIDILEEKVANFIETVKNLEKIIEKQKDKIELLREESSSVKESLGSKTLEAEGYRSDLEELRVKYEQQGECIMSLVEEIRELENPEDKEFASKSTTMLEDDFFMTTGTDITTSFSHMCHQCNCHLTQSQADLLRFQWSDMDVMPQTFDEDVHSIASGIAQHIVSSYAPPESEMRSNNVTRETEHHAPSVPQPQSQAKHRKDSHRRLTAVKKKEEKGQTREIRTVTQKASAKLPPIDKNKDASPRQATLLGVADLQHKLNFLIQEVMCYVNYAGRVLACGDDGKMCTNPKGVTPITPYTEKRTMAVRVAKERSNVAFFKRKKCRRTMMMTAQRTVILLREIYDAMAKELDLQHSEYEIIYRALKTVQRSQPAINTQHEVTPRGHRVTRGHQGQGHPHRCDRPPQTAPSSSELYASASQPRTNYEDMQQCIKQERVDIFNLDDSRAWRYHDNDSRREMVKTHTATVPKKGQIKVTALDYEIQNPDIYDKAKEPTEGREKKPRRHRPKSGKSYLIKRPDILEQIKMGGKLLAEERRQVEGEDVTAYTVRDLTAALSTNDPVTGRRSFISEIRGQMPPAFPLPAGSTPNARRQTVTPALQGHDPGLNPRCPTTATDAPAAYIVTPSAYNITPSGFRQTPGNYAGILAPHSHTPGQYNRILGRNTQTPGPNGPSTNHSRTLAGHSHSLGLRTSGVPGGGPIAQVYHPNTPGHQPHHNPQAYILTPSAYTLTPATLSPPVQTPNHSPPPCSLPPAPNNNATKATTKNEEKHVLLPGINDAHHPNK